MYADYGSIYTDNYFFTITNILGTGNYLPPLGGGGGRRILGDHLIFSITGGDQS